MASSHSDSPGRWLKCRQCGLHKGVWEAPWLCPPRRAARQTLTSADTSFWPPCMFFPGRKVSKPSPAGQVVFAPQVQLEDFLKFILSHQGKGPSLGPQALGGVEPWTPKQRNRHKHPSCQLTFEPREQESPVRLPGERKKIWNFWIELQFCD